jgi:AAA+ superfamily predicted ATPase
MALRFTSGQLKNALHQASGKPSFKVEKALKEAGLGKLLHQPSVSKDQFRKAIGALREEGVIHKSTGEVIRSTEKEITASDKPKLTLDDMRKQREAMQKKMASLYTREREATSAGKPQSATTAALRTTAKTSALTPKKVTGPRATTSALRSTGTDSSKKPAAEEKPQAIDLAID